MTRRLRVIAIVVFILAIGTGNAAAYDKHGELSIIVNLDGVPRMISTDDETVGELLDGMDDFINAEYTIDELTEESQLSNNMVINLNSIAERTITDIKTISFETTVKETSDLDEGQERVVQEGQNGTTNVVSLERYVGDDKISSEVIETIVIKEPQTEIIEKGTGASIDGRKYAYSIEVKATGYTPYDPGCNGITATGTKAQRGVIAVDPKVIPLGTRVYVPGYGEAVAEDTGGAIKGNKIDLCYTSKSEAYDWGVRNATVYVLK